MSDLVVLKFTWRGQSPLHSGYSSDFAKFAKGIGSQKISVNLETRDQDGNLEDAFLASSVKGVFRAASDWLVEKIAHGSLNLPLSQFVTCDYYGDNVPQDKKTGCPACRVYGGSGCRVGDEYREKSKVAFTFDQGDDAIHPEGEQRSYLFAHEQVTRKRGAERLKVETLKTEAAGFTLGLRIQPATDLAIALTCLAADLISSGFFRFGRFTSRGYGVVQLQPEAFRPYSLFDLLGKDQVEPNPTNLLSGYAVAQDLLDADPLTIIREEIRNYLQPEPANQQTNQPTNQPSNQPPNQTP